MGLSRKFAGCGFAAVLAALVAGPALADELALPEPEGVTAALPHSPMPVVEEALALPEPETEPVAPYAHYGCRKDRDETVYLTN